VKTILILGLSCEAAAVLPVRSDEAIVVKEVMSHHQEVSAINARVQVQQPGEAWLGLYNRSTPTVDLTGWKIASGIDCSFPAGKTIAPGACLVAANGVAGLQASHPPIEIVGNN
jgi:hypothetical protein